MRKPKDLVGRTILRGDYLFVPRKVRNVPRIIVRFVEAVGPDGTVWVRGDARWHPNENSPSAPSKLLNPQNAIIVDPDTVSQKVPELISDEA